MQCSENHPTMHSTRFGKEFIFIASILESDLNCEEILKPWNAHDYCIIYENSFGN